MRNRFAKVFHALGQKDERLCLVVADISPAGSIEAFRREFPDRFINVGVAEQIMIGMSAGMALRGFRPFAYTIATFALYRPFEFIRNDLCYQNIPVTVVGIGGGLTYSTLGATHHAMEDVSIACSLPNMRVIAPCDPYETEAATIWCATQSDGPKRPIYLRLGKAGEPDLGSPSPWVFGKVRQIRIGRDTAIVGYGPILRKAMVWAEKTDASVYSVHTLKPLDVVGLGNIMLNNSKVIVLEEGIRHGGLSMRLKVLAWKLGASCRIETRALRDEFIHAYGSHDDLLKGHWIP